MLHHDSIPIVMPKTCKIIVIVGPTASGKSALAVKLARRFNGEVISADSRQVYRGLNIGTGKITKRAMRGVPHHLLDVASPSRQYSAGQFKRDATKALRYIVANNKLPIICGGTGFYIDAVLGNISVPEVPPNTKLRKQLGRKTAPQLFTLLKKLDPRRARTIDPHNPVRLIRAIEIAKALGKVPTNNKQPATYNTLKIGLRLPDSELKQKIHVRLFARIREGVVAEARRLHRQGLSWKRMEALGLEYRYLAFYLQGKVTKEEMLKKLETKIWHYAKRQMHWWKKDPHITWYRPTQKKAITSKIKKFLN